MPDQIEQLKNEINSLKQIIQQQQYYILGAYGLLPEAEKAAIYNQLMNQIQNEAIHINNQGSFDPNMLHSNESTINDNKGMFR